MKFWDPQLESPAINEIITQVRRNKQDYEAVIDIICAMDYKIDGLHDIIEKSTLGEEWNNIDERQFSNMMKNHNHNLKAVAHAIGRELDSCCRYYYHRYRPSSHWSKVEQRKNFHKAMVKKQSNLTGVHKILGKKISSCLWYFYTKYHQSQEWKKLKEPSSHSDDCFICYNGGGKLSDLSLFRIFVLK